MGHEKWLALCACLGAHGALAAEAAASRPAVVAYVLPQDERLDPAIRCGLLRQPCQNAAPSSGSDP